MYIYIYMWYGAASKASNLTQTEDGETANFPGEEFGGLSLFVRCALYAFCFFVLISQ